MNLFMDKRLADGYKSPQQKTRVVTEDWAVKNLYCVRCGSRHLAHCMNNRPVADIYCPDCHNTYELKAIGGHFGRKINDGAYNTMIARLNSNDNPDLFVMEYAKSDYHVENFWAIPKYFFVPEIIERRAPIRASARRGGWTGCLIVWSEIPSSGIIPVIQNGAELPADEVVDKIRQTASLETRNLEMRGWLMDVLKCIDKMKDDEFSLSEMYEFSAMLKEKHVANKNINAKIRQQLQILRDKGFIEFTDGRGHYKKTRKLTGKKEFQVEVREYLQRVVNVEAKSAGEAVQKIRDAYKDKKIVLDTDDFKGYEIELYNDKN